jgi:DNA-directed RNA polymerase specialized sigma24 family protein
MIDFLALKFSGVSAETPDADRHILTEEIIASLPSECAALFRRFVTEDISPAEIADEVGAPAATFYSRWRRCLGKAREIFMHRKSGLIR